MSVPMLVMLGNATLKLSNGSLEFNQMHDDGVAITFVRLTTAIRPK
jgi:hypothetical protein